MQTGVTSRKYIDKVYELVRGEEGQKVEYSRRQGLLFFIKVIVIYLYLCESIVLSVAAFCMLVF